MRRRLLPFLALALAASACGTEAPTPLLSVGSARESISGGYVDEKTTGVVGLAISSSGHYFFGHCSGTLLAPNLVLTARHCVALTDGTPNEQVQCGVSQFSTTGGGGDFLASPDTVRPTVPDAPTFFRSVEVRVPAGPADFCGHDVALVILAGSGIPADLASPIEPRLDSTPSADEQFSAEGFGLTSPDETVDTSGTRRRIDGMTVTCAGANCRAVSDAALVNEWLSLDAAICPGDSGGPALDTKGRVMGVASRGSNCSDAIYGDVSSWRDLIVQAARDAADRGGYDTPTWAAAAAPDAATTSTVATESSDPLGQPCTNSCRSGYACYTETEKPPGICVPRCGPSLTACPSGYGCSNSIGACVPNASKSSGCAVSSREDSSNASTVIAAALALLGFGRFRQRR